MRAGRPKTPGLPRTKSGRGSRRRQDLIDAGKMVHTEWAVYFAQAGTLTKIGYSGSLANRLYLLGYHEGEPARLVAAVFVPSEEVALRLERKLQAMFSEHLARGREWFLLSRGDILGSLADCRKLGLRVVGGQDASPDRSVLSSAAYTDENDQVTVLMA